MSKKVETAEDVRKLTDEEVGIELSRLRNQLYALRSTSVTGKVEDNSAFRITRRSIARLLTEKNARRYAKAGTGRTAAKSGSKSAGKSAAGKAPAAPVAKVKSSKPVGKKTVNAKTRPSARKANKAAK